MPTTMQIATRGPVPDIFGMSIGPYVFSQRMRVLVDELEPDRHKFVPIKMVSKGRIHGKTDHGTYYLLLPPPVLDCIDADATVFQGDGVASDLRGVFNRFLSRGFSDPVGLRRDVVAGHHLWRIPDGRGAQYVCSSELWNRMQETGIKGWVVKKKCMLR